MTGFCDVPAESQAKKIPTQRSRSKSLERRLGGGTDV